MTNDSRLLQAIAVIFKYLGREWLMLVYYYGPTRHYITINYTVLHYKGHIQSDSAQYN